MQSTDHIYIISLHPSIICGFAFKTRIPSSTRPRPGVDKRPSPRIGSSRSSWWSWNSLCFVQYWRGVEAAEVGSWRSLRSLKEIGGMENIRSTEHQWDINRKPHHFQNLINMFYDLKPLFWLRKVLNYLWPFLHSQVSRHLGCRVVGHSEAVLRVKCERWQWAAWMFPVCREIQGGAPQLQVGW